MSGQRANQTIGKPGRLVVAAMSLFIALSSTAVVRADDPPKKSDGKVKFTVGPVTHTPDSKTPKQQKQPDPNRKQDTNKSKQSPPPKGN